MVRHSKPRAGSKAYWPRKRAKRIYPRLKTVPEIAETRLLAFAGYKAGMMHAVVVDNVKGSATFGQEIVVPVTVLDCPALIAAGMRAYVLTPKGLEVLTEAWAGKLSKETLAALGRKIKTGNKMKAGNMRTDEKLAEIEKATDSAGRIASLRLIVATRPELTSIGKRRPDVFEIEISGKTAREKFDFAKQLLGKEIKVADVVKEGELVDAIAVTTGKGTAGPMKRFGIAMQTRHAKEKRRHVGTLGQERPGKVRHTVPQAGQMGLQRRTELNKRILKIGSGNITPTAGFNRYGTVKAEYVVVEGSVPGPKKRLILLRAAIRPKGARIVVKEVKKIVE